MTDQPTIQEWNDQHSATTNWGPWPITDPDTYLPFGDEHAAAVAWCATRGLDLERVPVKVAPEYGNNEYGQRTVTLDLFALDENGRRMLLPDDEQTEDRIWRYERVTVVDEPPHHTHIHMALPDGAA